MQLVILCVITFLETDETDDDSETNQANEEPEETEIDANLISNLLQSVKAQEGLAGPASNLLRNLGMQLSSSEIPQEELD